MIKFCSQCGVKVEYKFSPPKFCSSCGSPMGVAAANESKPLNRSVKSRRQSKAISDDETDAEFVPQLDRLEYDLDDFGASHNHTIGSLGGKAPMKRRKMSKRNIDDDPIR